MSLRKIHTKLMLLFFIMISFAVYLQIRYHPFNQATDPTSQEQRSTAENEAKKNQYPKAIIINQSDEEFTVFMETASTPEERAEGLMYRENLDKEYGMLFIYRKDNTGQFWMKNCKITLDMIFMDTTGKITFIVNTAIPCQEDAQTCLLYGDQNPYRYVLEVNGGWCEEHNVVIGDSVQLPTEIIEQAK